MIKKHMMTHSDRRLIAFLFLPSFFTVASVNLVCIHLAYGTLVTSGDMSRSALFLTTQFLVPSLTAPLFLRMTRRLETRRILLLIDALNLLLVACLIAAVSAGLHASVIYGLVGLLGLSIFVLRSGRLEFVKLGQDAEARATLNSVAQTSLYVGVATGAGLVPLVEGFSIQVVACVAGAGFALSGVLTLLLCPRGQGADRPDRQIALKSLIGRLLSHRGLCLSFVFVVATMGLLQSLMQILRIAVPVHVLHGSASLVSGLQMVMIAGFIVAAMIVAVLRIKAGAALTIFALFAAALACATLATKLPVVWAAFGSMFLFIVFFEIAFLLALNRMISDLPGSCIFGMSILYQIVGGTMMILTSTLGAELYDQAGLNVALGLYWFLLLGLGGFWAAIAIYVRTAPPQQA